MSSQALSQYLEQTPRDKIDAGFVAYLASLTEVAKVEPLLARRIVQELADQRSHLKLIASENYCSLSTQLAMGNLLTDKYAEGISQARFYAGCDNVDAIEDFAAAQARQLFGVEHAYVQPHSGADANLVAFWAILSARVLTPALEKLGETNPSKLDAAAWEKIRQACGNQRLLGLDYYSGGHLTHGYRLNISAQMFEAHGYQVDRATGLLDYAAIERQALEVRPLILLAGYSAYPRKIDFRRMREIADKVGAVLMVDMAHFAGLVAGGVHPSPIPHAHVVTSTTHKSLRGPRGGLILTNDEALAKKMNSAVFPGLQGGPHNHTTAAIAVALHEAATPAFETYAHRIVENARALADRLLSHDFTLVSGGTDNHLILVDLNNKGVSGKIAAQALEGAGIVCNANSVPFDPRKPFDPSGIRLGTPALTTRGMGPAEMLRLADWIAEVVAAPTDTAVQARITGEILDLCQSFPAPGV